MANKWTDGYDPDEGDEQRLNEVAVQPVSGVSGDQTDAGSTKIGYLPEGAILLAAIITIENAAATNVDDVELQQADGTAFVVSGSANSLGLETVAPETSHDSFSEDKEVHLEILDNSNSGVEAYATLLYA